MNIDYIPKPRQEAETASTRAEGEHLSSIVCHDQHQECQCLV